MCRGECAGLRLLLVSILAAVVAQARGSGERRMSPARPATASVSRCRRARCFEAVLEDVSVADAPATELGRATIADPGNPPFDFEIAFDPDDVEPERTYSVRAQVSVGGG